MELWLRFIAVVLVLAFAQPASGRETDQCAELARYEPPGALAITRGEIIGLPDERAPMTKSIPLRNGAAVSVGYLVGGDQVDFVEACKG